MRALLLLLTVIVLTGCATPPPAPKPLTGETLTAALSTSGLPIANVNAYTAETDPNHLLGRPNQYIAKVNWADTRLDAERTDATIEVFASKADLQARQKYTQAISDSGGLFAQYVVPNESRLALMRLPHQLTPEQADAYKAWFAAL